MAQRRTYQHHQEEDRVGREREAAFHRSGDIRCCCRHRFDCDVDDETVEGTLADENEEDDEDEEKEATADGDQRANELD